MVIARMSAGALRWPLHLSGGCAGLSTMVGQQPWSHHPLVDLLDRTQPFIGPMAAKDGSRSNAKRLRPFGLGSIACQTNVCCRSHSLGNWEPPAECARIRVYNFASVPGDPIIGLRSKCPRHTCWRAMQASSRLDLKLPRIAPQKVPEIPALTVFSPCSSPLSFHSR